jgi:hypothetical protein
MKKVLWKNLETQFQAALIENVYLPNLRVDIDQQVLLSMIAKSGGLASAKSLLNGPVQVGFRGLRRGRHLNLTVEHLVIQDPWRGLFSEKQIATAKQRLGTRSAGKAGSGHGCNASDCPLRRLN